PPRRPDSESPDSPPADSTTDGFAPPKSSFLPATDKAAHPPNPDPVKTRKRPPCPQNEYARKLSPVAPLPLASTASRPLGSCCRSTRFPRSTATARASPENDTRH